MKDADGASQSGKSFTGQWLIAPDEHLIAEQDDSGVHRDQKVVYAVAQTAKGAIAVYETDPDEDRAPRFEVYNDFEAFKNARIDNRYPVYPQNVVAEVTTRLGLPYEVELDI